MSKKNIKSIFLISLAGVGIWLLGLVLIFLLDFENFVAVNKAWIIIMFVGTLIVSVKKNIKK